jgi:hypothetical protein
MIVVSELLATEIATRIPAALAAVEHDAADPDWRCIPTGITLPSVDELQRVADDAVERIVLLEDGPTIVGLCTVAADGRLRWMILDTSNFYNLLEPLGDWIVEHVGVQPGGVVGGENQRLATMDAHPRVLIESQTDNDGVISTVVRWV